MASYNIALRLTTRTLEAWQGRCLRQLFELAGAVTSVAVAPAGRITGWPANLPVPLWLSDAEAGDETHFKQQQPIIFLDLGRKPDPQRWAPHARFGCWWFHWGDSGFYADAAVGELWARKRGVEANLLALGYEGGITVVESGSIKAVGHSWRATRSRLLNTAAEWPARGLCRYLEDIRRSRPAPARAGQPTELPRWRRWLLPYALMRNGWGRLLDESLEEHWCLGVIEGNVADVAMKFDAGSVRWLPEMPRGHLADPFVIVDGAKTIILAEAYGYKERRGFIVAFERLPNGDVTPPEPVLRLPCHCSYPQVLQHEGQFYLIPEAARAGCVRLYRAVSFPTSWVLDRVLISNFAGVDPTVFRHDERWWLFATDYRDQDEVNLHIFYADDLFGPWRSHRLNPVKSDLAGSRPAGTPFVADGKILRPAQDGTNCYGGAIVLNHVSHLTPEVFLEEPIGVIRPDAAGPYPNGIRTVNGIAGLTVIDGKRRQRSLRRLLAGVRRLARS